MQSPSCTLSLSDAYEPDLCEAPTVEDYVQVEGGGQGLKKHQMVMELDMETWKVR